MRFVFPGRRRKHRLQCANHSDCWQFQLLALPIMTCNICAKHAIAHKKIMIIDYLTIITGSFNFTKAAEDSNAENLLVIQDADLVLKYTKNWQEHQKHSDAYTR
jgi:phosphatidylserine/phosphatidylglycerophosphate/cardiolipin synthase-like enzyme